jgi:nucleoside-diphosphate-sugar epimerase
MSRNIIITAADGQTGFLVAELLLTNNDFKSKVDSVTCLTLHPSSAKAKELTKLGAKVVPHHPGREREMVKVLKDSGCDTICLIPPTHKDKVDITMELIAAARKANVKNGLLISSVGCDLAERDKQPRLREFIDIEAKFLESKGVDGTMLGQSPCVIRWAESCNGYDQQQADVVKQRWLLC